MKKILMLLWTLAAVAILFFFVRHLTTNDKHIITDIREYADKSTTDVFSKHSLDSLLLDNEYVFLTIGYDDCSLCYVLLLDKTPDKFPVSRYYIDATYNNNNMLVLQSLYYRGFPLTYIIDRGYNIIGVIKGLNHLGERLDSIIHEKHGLIPETIADIPHDKTLSVLSDSFKGLLSFLDNDDEKMRYHAEMSLEGGSFFFNNYLMYRYYKDRDIADSTNYYRNKALGSLSGSDIYIYKTLVAEIDPENIMLQWCDDEHHHKHEHHH